jgi:radical SAM superfamily enzyme YgiQ (UPF0313 family)
MKKVLARYVREQNVGLVGIGAMTRMIAKAYRMADTVRAVGVKVVRDGPHVTEMADESLGRDGGSHHADAVALGEADETWPRIVKDAVRGTLKDVCMPVDDIGQERKPSLQSYPKIPWNKIKLHQFTHCSNEWALMGNLSNYSRGVRAWLSLRMRVLHRGGIFWRLDPVSNQ